MHILMRDIAHLVCSAGQILQQQDLLVADHRVAAIGEQLQAPVGSTVVDV